jgi:hypothetical protein
VAENNQADPADQPRSEGSEGVPVGAQALDGASTGELADPDIAYVREQIGSLGSGALGGASGAGLGGSFDMRPDEAAEVVAEAKRILKAHGQGPAHVGYPAHEK